MSVWLNIIAKAASTAKSYLDSQKTSTAQKASSSNPKPTTAAPVSSSAAPASTVQASKGGSSSSSSGSSKQSAITPYAAAPAVKTASTSGVKGINANNNNILSQLKNFMGGTAAVPKSASAKSANTYNVPESSAKSTNIRDWTKENWSVDYGKFLNDLQGNAAKLEAERQRTVSKMQSSGGGNKDQVAHLKRVEDMLKSVSPQKGLNVASGISPAAANSQSLTSNGRTVNRTTKQDNIASLSSFGNAPLGWNDKNNDRLNLSYLPKGMKLNPNDRFSVGAHVITGADGNAVIGPDGNVQYEYRPIVHYDKTGLPTFAPKSDIVMDKGGRNNVNGAAYGLDNQYGYDSKQVMGFETPLVEVMNPTTGSWSAMDINQAETTFRHLVEGGYATEAERSKYIRDTGKFSKATDLQNSYAQSENDQGKNAMNNQMFNDDPQKALSYRAQLEDDRLRAEHFNATGENLPKDHFMPEILERQSAEQERINKFLEAIKTNPNILNAAGVVSNQTNASPASSDVSSSGKIDWSKANWSSDYTKLLQGLEGNADALRAEIDRTNAKIKAQGSPATEQQKGHLDRLNHMMNGANISSGSYDPGNRFEVKPAQPDQIIKPASSATNAAAPLAKAATFTGTAYKWGGTTPDGFDCSGLTQYVFKQSGIDLPRTAAEQYKVGKAVDLKDAKANDLVFFKNTDGRDGITHVGIIQGDGTFLGAQTKGVGTQNLNSEFWKSRIVGVKRVGEFDAKEQKTASMVASTNPVVNAVTKIFNPTAQTAPAANANTTDWTKYNWSKEYGTFLNKIQNDPAAVDSEINKTLNKIQSLGAKAGADQYSHLERLQSMKANLPKAVENPTAAYNDFNKLPANTQQQIAAPQDSLVELLRQQMEAGNAQMDKLYQQYMDMAGNMSIPQVAKLTWDQAMKQASAQLDPLYKEKMDATMDAVNQDLIARGFFGQVPGGLVTAKAAASVASEKASNLAQFAQGLVDRSADEANQIIAQQMQFQQNQLSNFLQGINLYNASNQSKKGDLLSLIQYQQGERAYQQQSEQNAFERYIKERELMQKEADSEFNKYIKTEELSLNQQKFLTDATGYLNGNPTIGTQKILSELGLKQADLELAMRKAQSEMERGWANIEIAQKNAQTSAYNASVNGARYEHDASNNYIKQNEYYADLQRTAMDMAVKEFTALGYPDQPDFVDRDISGNDRYGKILQSLYQKNLEKVSGINISSLNIPNTSGRPSK